MKKKLLSIFAIMALSVSCMTACGKEAEPEKETETKVEESKKDSDTDDTEISTGTERPDKEDKDDNETPEVGNHSQDEQPDVDEEPLSKVDNQETDTEDIADNNIEAIFSNPANGMINGQPMSDWIDVISDDFDEFALIDGTFLSLYDYSANFENMISVSNLTTDTFQMPGYRITDNADSARSMTAAGYNDPYAMFTWKDGLKLGDTADAVARAYGEPDNIYEVTADYAKGYFDYDYYLNDTYQLSFSFNPEGTLISVTLKPSDYFVRL